MADYNFVDVDSSKIYNEVIGSLMESCNEPLYPGDERRIFGEGIVTLWVALYNLFNDQAKQRTLQNARGEVLDAIGDMFYKTERASPSFASATFRFSVDQALNQNIVIPAGTMVTTDGSVYFATEETAVLQAGELSVDVLGVCMTGGSAYNGFTAGTIGTMVDLVPYISSVQNITTSTGGDDGEPYTEEGDNRYRQRIGLASSTLSTAGTKSAYRYFALSADPDIVDVSIYIPSPSVVHIYPLMQGGELPGEETIDKVSQVFMDDKVRPMTDTVTVAVPSTVEYSVHIKYYCSQDDLASTVQTIEGEGGAIDRYNEWQQTALGRDINPDQLRRFILAPSWAEGLTGAVRVDVTSPSFTEVPEYSVARLAGVTVSYEVI